MSNKNKTIQVKNSDYLAQDTLITLSDKSHVSFIENKIIHQDIFDALPHLPENFVDLLFIDPPYNLTKSYQSHTFKEMTSAEYEKWFEAWFVPLLKILKPTASVYVCCDWKTSVSVYKIISQHLKIKNRITWEREKGRGAYTNWKNCHEDIWFATVSDHYYFNAEAVKMLRKVLAPYKTIHNQPKDWFIDNNNQPYRLTYPSNLWTDITIPFWSMPENTDHPTQKPEKLLAKIILASTRENDFVFDPFLGSGTTAVTAKKLNRKYCGIEINQTYCHYTLKRLEMAETDKKIQGYENGVFLERNTSFSKLKKLFTPTGV
ncbi:MAG: site-specific DNA-methyltransferase [Bacteroidia bacterium]|nr:site-specific DNA-methyltransferase [Bacteroidia bacterium]